METMCCHFVSKPQESCLQSLGTNVPPVTPPEKYVGRAGVAAQKLCHLLFSIWYSIPTAFLWWPISSRVLKERSDDSEHPASVLPKVQTRKPMISAARHYSFKFTHVLPQHTGLKCPNQQLCRLRFLLFPLLCSAHGGRKRIAVDAVQAHMACLVTFREMKKKRSPGSKFESVLILF